MKIDVHSETWTAVREDTEDRLAELRAQNETPGLPLEVKEGLCGGIAELKALLQLSDPVPDPAPGGNYNE